MPCGCNKKKAAGPQKFTFTPQAKSTACPDCEPKPKPIEFNTEVEARAAKIRAGGGTVEPAP